jgi:magnesium-transporting ATPase (P-type)
MNELLDKIESNRLFKFIKENFSLLIFLPSLLGGLRQFLILLYYSPTLIQYFSFSQLAIDGLETIIQSLYVTIVTIIVYKVVKNKLYTIFILIFIFFLIILRFSWYVIVEAKEYSLFSYNLTTLKSYSYKILSLTGISFYIALGYALKNIDDTTHRFRNTLVYIVSSVGIVLLLYFIILYRPFQYNVQNVVEVTNKVRKEQSSCAELVYYNDNYLIFVLNPKNKIDKRKYFVKKFESLFEESEKK